MESSLKPLRFINETIQVVFNAAPLLEKKPGLPAAFIWRDQHFAVKELISEWHDYQRRGRMRRNMSIEHSSASERHGSWGVGQDFYRVRTADERIFELYYDRAPQDVDRRKGGWYLYRELSEVT
jgi:hypothetical protein